MKQFLQYLFISVLLASSVTLFAQVPQNWTRDEINPGADFTLIPDESFFTEGFKSCHLQLNTGAAPYLVSGVYFVTPGTAYEFSFDVFDNDTAGQVKVYADFYDAYGFDVFGKPPVFSSDSEQWQTIRWEGTIPASAVVGYVLIKFYCQPDLYSFTRNAHVWIDNIRFVQSGGDNLLINGGFEEWMVNIDENRHEENTLFLYPNPAKDAVNLKFPGTAEFIVISDLLGREVLRIYSTVVDNFQIDILTLSQGIYLLSVIQKDNRILQEKLIVSR